MNNKTPELVTSVVKWVRYDGTPETLPEEGREVMIPVDTMSNDIVVVRYQFLSGISKWCGLVWHIEQDCKAGDLWAYLPTPPEGME